MSLRDSRSWLQRWNAYWFPTTTTLNLGGARIMAVAAELFWFFPSLSHQIALATKNTHFVDPQPLIRLITAVVPREAVFTPTVLTLMSWVVWLAGCAALIGLWTRAALFVLALGEWILVSHAYSYGDVHHNQALFSIFLLALAFSPAGESLSVDALLRRRRAGARAPTGEPVSDMAMWPLKLAHVLLALTYFETGISKILAGGLRWMNGYTLQISVMSDAIPGNLPVGIWLAQHHRLCIVLSVFTILFETLYFLSLFLPRVAPFFFFGGILFHINLYLTGGHPFFPHIVMNAMLLVFLDSRWFPALVRRLQTDMSRSGASQEAGQTP
ncbi:MAG: HTTM domain-containing protein [Gemmatimonadales bacterium]